MRYLVIGVVALLLGSNLVHGFEDQVLEDDDFAEFEQFDADEATVEKSDFEDDMKEVPVQKSKSNEQFETRTQEEELVVEDEDNEFDHFHDPEEFEGFQDSAPRAAEQPKITISKVPMLVRPRWDAYWLEAILCCLLAAYALAYVVGRTKNTAIAVNFLKMHKPLLDDNFTLVGETGSDIVGLGGEERGWRREAEHVFTLWCSGRLCCEGMLLTLKLIKRQDLVHVILGVVKPSPDTLQIRIELGKDDSDPFVLCIAQKKIAARLSKEMHDLSVFCPEKRPGDKHGLPNTLSVMSECAEAATGVLDARTTAALNMYHQNVQYIHISDSYCGPKQMEEQATTKPPDTERVMLVSLALSAGDGQEVRPLLQLVMHVLDRLRRLRLSKEALAKCEKRRQKVAEAWLRGAHAARQEQAAARREEKRKIEKEKILASVFCPEKRPGDKHGLPNTLSVMSECAEAATGVLDARTTAALNMYHQNVQYIHISDSYCGPKQMEEQATTKPPDTERVMLVSLALSAGDGQEVRPLLQLVMHVLDRLRRLRLSKEALAKCEKRRQKVAEAWLRGAHAARQEQAAARREEKRKIEKEKILAEDDPEKQRRWELKEQKRQAKRKTPKMKQLKVKAL